MRVSNFIFDWVHLLYYKWIKSRCIIYSSPEWIKNKKATINAINKKYNKCFQYAVKIELNHEKIRKNSDRMTKIRPVTNKYNKEKINFTSKKGHWKKLRKII